jgi:hypothetical protein
MAMITTDRRGNAAIKASCPRAFRKTTAASSTRAHGCPVRTAKAAGTTIPGMRWTTPQGCEVEGKNPLLYHSVGLVNEYRHGAVDDAEGASEAHHERRKHDPPASSANLSTCPHRTPSLLGWWPRANGPNLRSTIERSIRIHWVDSRPGSRNREYAEERTPRSRYRGLPAQSLGERVMETSPP